MKEFSGHTFENQQEVEPTLPTDPNEAASWLKEIWETGGGWMGQPAIRQRKYQELNEEEKQLFDATGREFRWLAELHDSELVWMKSYAQTNYGEVFGFRFGYEVPESPEDDVPNAYVYRPFNKEKEEVFVSQGGSGWTVRPLKELSQKHQEYFGF